MEVVEEPSNIFSAEGATVRFAGNVADVCCINSALETTEEMVAVIEDATRTRFPADAVDEIVEADIAEPRTRLNPTPVTVVVDMFELLLNSTFGTVDNDKFVLTVELSFCTLFAVVVEDRFADIKQLLVLSLSASADVDKIVDIAEPD